MPVVSISDAQRGPLPDARWAGTIYHGLPSDKYRLGRGKGDYLLFLGRISPEKRADRAIAIARQAKIPLKIAAKVDVVDKAYFDAEIRPLLNGTDVEFLGEVNDEQKNELLGNAKALLFPIDWPEPFGLVLIEALACGTPAIAFRRGSVPEIIEDGVTGFIVEDVEQAVVAVKSIDGLDRVECRRIFDQRFSARRMAQDYLHLYEKVLNAQTEIVLRGNRGRRNHPAQRSLLRTGNLIAS